MLKQVFIISVSLLSLLAFISCPPPPSSSDKDRGDNRTGPSLSELIIGYWVEDSLSFPDSTVSNFTSGNAFNQYFDYQCTPPPWISTWSLSGDILTIENFDTFKIVKINNNQADLYDETGAFHISSYYRKGTEPGGYTFDLTLSELTVNADYEVHTLPQGSANLFSFDATIDTWYDIYWDDMDHGGLYDCDIVVNAYEADQATDYFLWGDGDCVDNPEELQANDNIVYLVVFGFSEFESGDYAIKIEE